MKKLARKGLWWTDEEVEILSEKWGKRSAKDLSRQLGRSVGAIKRKAKDIGMGFRVQNADGVSMKMLLSIICGHNASSKDYKRFKQAGLPYFTLKTEQRKFYMVNIDKFWKWAEENQDMIEETRSKALAVIEKNIDLDNKKVDYSQIKNEVREQLGKYYYHETECKPMIITVIQEV